MLLIPAACGTAAPAGRGGTLRPDPPGGTRPKPAADPPAALPSGVIPYQYIAKSYTELLGRAPRPAEWTAAVDYFDVAGCTVTSLRSFGESVIGTAEYGRDYPVTVNGADSGAIALTLFRFVLNREPDAPGYVAVRDAIASGTTTPEAAADQLYGSSEFAAITAPAICSTSSPSYWFGQPGNWTGYPALQTPVVGAPGPDDAETTLQAELDARAAAGGGTVTMPQREVTGLTTTLTIPGNVTLTTQGDPDPNQYADMAMLARLPSFTQLPGYPGDELVRLEPGAHLVHVWVDGQRDYPDPNHFGNFDVRVLGGAGTTVADNRLGNTFGASTLEADDNYSNVPGAGACSNMNLSDNLVEAYSTSHVDLPDAAGTDHPQADGFGVYCTHATVEGNDFVDISDTAVALFDGSSLMTSTPPQLSVVSGNTIVSAGNSYSFGIAVDPSYSLGNGPTPGGDPPGVVTRQFSTGRQRTRITDNVMWTGDRTHINVLLSIGSHDLFGSTVHQNCTLPGTGGATCGGGRNAIGPVVTGNGSDGLLTEVEMGIYVGGTSDSVVLHNQFPDIVEVAGGFCPKYAVVVVGPFAPGLQIDLPVHDDATSASDSCVNPRF
jgi:hypothetical protein